MMMEQKNLVPKRRFRKFQDNDAWEQCKLGMLADSFEYGLNAASIEYDGENKYLRITDISDETHEFKSDVLTSPNVDLAMAKKYQLKTGDVLFARTGASVGKSYRYKESDGLVYYAGFLIRARIKPEYDYEFVFQNTLTDKYNRFIKITSQRSGQPGVNAQEYAAFELSVPKLEEQRKIGAFFNQLDNLITLHQRKLDKTKALKSAYLSEMFPAEGESEPKRRFAGFTDAWEQREYGEVIDLLSGQDFSPSEYNDTCNGIPYMTGASCIVGKETIVNRWTTVPRCLAEKGDVLLVCKGSGYGAIAVLAQEKAHIARQFMALKNLPNLDKVFNFYLLNSVIENIKKDARGLIAGIARDAVIKQEISIPSLEEQSQIGVFFKKIDHLITLHQYKLEKLQNIKKAYLNEMFV